MRPTFENKVQNSNFLKLTEDSAWHIIAEVIIWVEYVHLMSNFSSSLAFLLRAKLSPTLERLKMR